TRFGAPSYCSGTVIAPDTVLTAGHCVCTTNVIGGNVCLTDVQVEFPGPDNSLRVLDGKATFHPDYNPSWIHNDTEHDFAIVKVGGTSPKYATPLFVARDVPHTGSIVELAGWGDSGPGCTQPGFFALNYELAPIQTYDQGHDVMRFAGELTCH